MPQALDPSSALSKPLSEVALGPGVAVVGDDDIRLTRGPRHYRVRGLAPKKTHQ